jgi:hypothetical protein
MNFLMEKQQLEMDALLKVDNEVKEVKDKVLNNNSI